jgi:hypothetical protein
MQWFHDGATHHYDDPGPDERPTNSPYGSERKIMVTLDGITFPAETGTWTKHRVWIHWHDDHADYQQCWVPAENVRRADDHEHNTALHEQFQRVSRRLTGD